MGAAVKDHLSEKQICAAITSQSRSEDRRHLEACAICRCRIDAFARVIAAFRSTVTLEALQVAGARPGSDTEWRVASGTARSGQVTPSQQSSRRCH
jgi:hypothetical protein